MDNKKTEAEEYCRRVDQIIQEMDENKPLEEIPGMINELEYCAQQLREIQSEYEMESKRLFEKNGGGTDSFEALATVNMLSKIQWVLEEIPSFVELAQAVIAENGSKAKNVVEEKPELQESSLDDLPEFFGEEEMLIEPIEIVPEKQEDIVEEQTLENEDDELEVEEIDKPDGLDIETKEEAEKEDEAVLEAEEIVELLGKTNVITINEPTTDYRKVARDVVSARKGETNPVKVAEDGRTIGQQVIMQIQKVLIPKKVAAKEEKGQNYERERERGDED